MYRRRRIVAGILVLLILAGLIAGIIGVVNLLRGAGASGDGQPAAASASPSPSGTQPADGASASPAPSASATATASEAVCDPSKIRVSAETNAHSYENGRNPVLTMRVSNVGTEPCQLNVGTTRMEFVIYAGSERIFSSRDCQVEPQDLMRTIEPGTTEQANFVWERNRTEPGCQPTDAVPGPGTYQFQAILGEITGDLAQFTLS